MSFEATEKEIELMGKEYKILKLDPFSAFRWIPQVIGKSENMDMKNLAPAITAGVTRLTQLERKLSLEFFNDCLKHVEVKYPAGYAPFIGLDGNYATQSPPAIMALLVHVFMFTVVDFFDQAFLGSLVGALEHTCQTIGSEISSSSPSEKATGNKKNSKTEHTI